MIGKLFLLFIVLPLTDMYLLLQVGASIGTYNTLILIVATGIAGAILYQTQSRLNMQQIGEAMRKGFIPDIEMIDRVLITAGAILLMTPGIVTDIAGFLVLLPFTRPLVRNTVKFWLKKKVDQGHIRIETF